MTKLLGGLLAGSVAYAIARRIGVRPAPRNHALMPQPEDSRVTAARLIG